MKSAKRRLIEAGSDNYVDISWINVEIALKIVKECTENLIKKIEEDSCGCCPYDKKDILAWIKKFIGNWEKEKE